MRDNKYLMHYRMFFNAFNHLVQEWFLFLKSKCFNPMKAQLKIRKIIAIVLCSFDHGFSFKHMPNRFDVGASTIWKYMDMVVIFFVTKTKILDKYISTPFVKRLWRITHQFQKFTGLSNIGDAIDVAHIPLVIMSSKTYTSIMSDYYNKTKFHNTVVQVVCDMKKIFDQGSNSLNT